MLVKLPFNQLPEDARERLAEELSARATNPAAISDTVDQIKDADAADDTSATVGMDGLVSGEGNQVAEPNEENV